MLPVSRNFRSSFDICFCLYFFFRKYIHRVICQSGVAVTESFFQVEPEEKARKLARFFGYTGDSDQGVLGE